MKHKTTDINKKIGKLFLEAKNIILTSHTNPDGDAIGSVLAFYHFGKSLGKNVTIINDSPTPQNISFLNGVDDIRVFDRQRDFEKFLMCDLIIINDLNDPARLKNLEEYIVNSNATKIVIDHHLNPKGFADIIHVDPSASSTGEMVWQIFNANNFNISKATAEALFVAIMTDTGNFRHNRTDSEVFKIAADLIDNGADPVAMYDMVYNRNSLAAIQLLGEALKNIELFYDDKVSIMSIPVSLLSRTGAEQDDLEGFVEQTLSINGVKIGIMMADVPEKEEVRMSFRSKENYSVRELAKQFGGGGHFNAAGARLSKMQVAGAKEIVLNKIKDVFDI